MYQELFKRLVDNETQKRLRKVRPGLNGWNQELEGIFLFGGFGR